MTGSGSSGSWIIRGLQLGAAIGATVEPDADARAIRAHDLVVLVKRPRAPLLQRIHAAGVPLVWDVVDAWPQPVGNGWSREQALAWLTEQVRAIRPAAAVAATSAMAADLRPLVSDTLALPHHARPGLEPNPVRDAVHVVGYEGSERHLGAWAQIVAGEAARRGWRFAVNPARLADVDIVVALREVEGYAPRMWKSNVKHANAAGSGTPFVGCRERGYLEQSQGGEHWADNPRELAAAFDALTPAAARREAAERMRAARPALDDIAARYAVWLQGVKRCATAPRF